MRGLEPSQGVEPCSHLYKRRLVPCASAGSGCRIRTHLGSFKGSRPTTRRTLNGARYGDRTRVSCLEGRRLASRPISRGAIGESRTLKVSLRGTPLTMSEGWRNVQDSNPRPLLGAAVFKTVAHTNVRRSVVAETRIALAFAGYESAEFTRTLLRSGSDRGIRTPTERVLKPSPLPLGYVAWSVVVESNHASAGLQSASFCQNSTDRWSHA